MTAYSAKKDGLFASNSLSVVATCRLPAVRLSNWIAFLGKVRVAIRLGTFFSDCGNHVLLVVIRQGVAGVIVLCRVGAVARPRGRVRAQPVNVLGPEVKIELDIGISWAFPVLTFMGS